MQGKIGVDGHEQIPSESPQVNGFGFVAPTPSLEPVTVSIIYVDMSDRLTG